MPLIYLGVGTIAADGNILGAILGILVVGPAAFFYTITFGAIENTGTQLAQTINEFGLLAVGFIYSVYYIFIAWRMHRLGKVAFALHCAVFFLVYLIASIGLFTVFKQLSGM